MQRILWIPIISLFASTTLDRATTLLGLSAGLVETNPIQQWILTHFPLFFYTSAFIFPATISLMFTFGIHMFGSPSLRYHRMILSVFFVGLSVISWTPVLNNLLLLRAIA